MSRTSTTRSYRSNFYCSACSDKQATAEPMIALPQFCKDNYITRDQLRRYLRLKVCLAMKLRGRYYVCVNPEFKDMNWREI